MFERGTIRYYNRAQLRRGTPEHSIVCMSKVIINKEDWQKNEQTKRKGSGAKSCLSAIGRLFSYIFLNIVGHVFAYVSEP